jgi:phosphotriesterase-related protein
MPENQVFTVNGPIAPEELGLTDSHAHVWIIPPKGAPSHFPRLDQFNEARQELKSFRCAGGSSLIDCQPGGAGRNSLILRRLSVETGVHIIASTGFHIKKYYPEDYWLFSSRPEIVTNFFIKELTEGMMESTEEDRPILAGQIKIACPADPKNWPETLMKTAARAAILTGSAIQVHTERGAGANQILVFFENCGLDPQKLILAHMDKRPDFILHKSLIKAGALLEYDTFSRKKYAPENNVWPLIIQLAEHGLLSEGVTLANDLAYEHEWQAFGGEPGLSSLPKLIPPRLKTIGMNEKTITKITGGNIARRLARPAVQSSRRFND